jgi:hypothetical protein
MTSIPTSTEPSQPASPTYRPKGKIAWLPKSVRDRINGMLLAGHTYAGILKELGPDGNTLNISNLFRYHKNQYRHWLREQHWPAEARARFQTPASWRHLLPVQKPAIRRHAFAASTKLQIRLKRK